MPIKDSAKKYMRVTTKNTKKNRLIHGTYRSAIRQLEKAIADGDEKEIEKWLKQSQKTLDKATQKKVIKKRMAARKKSRLNKIVITTKQK